VGGFLGYHFSKYLPQTTQTEIKDTDSSETITTQKVVKEESAVIDAVKKSSPAVVSIIVTKDLPKMQQYLFNPFGRSFPGFGIPMYRQEGFEKKEIGGGTGFIVTKDGYIVTNKHVVQDPSANYTVLLNDERRFDAKVLARDTVNDVAVLKITGEDFHTIKLGSSEHVVVGQTVIAIGNSLGEFRNTVSTGVISGLSRSLTAGSAGRYSDHLTDLIQTDAAINPGNSGGPLLNLAGEVIGINTAIVYNSQNIGFAIPVDSVKSVIQSVSKYGRIVRPYLGVRYVQITKSIMKAYKLKVDYGVIIIGGKGRSDFAVAPGSPAHKAGLKENDIITKINKIKLDKDTLLAKVLSKFQPGDEINLTIIRDGHEETVSVLLEELSTIGDRR